MATIGLTFEELENIVRAEFQAQLEFLRKEVGEEELARRFVVGRNMEAAVNARLALYDRYLVLTELVLMTEYGDEPDNPLFANAQYRPVLEPIYQNALNGIFPDLRELSEKKEWPIPSYHNHPLAAMIKQVATSSASSLIFRDKNWFNPTDTDDQIKQQARAYLDRDRRTPRAS